MIEVCAPVGEVLPAAIAEELRRFLASGKTGKIILDVQEGRVRQARAEVVWPATLDNPNAL